VGAILRECKGELSYEHIARNARLWLEDQEAKGRKLPSSHITSEYVRRICNGEVQRVSEHYLEALAVAMGANLDELRDAAGYALPTDPVRRVDVFLNGMDTLSDFTKEEIRRIVQEELERSKGD
jgi:hypothetical protein